MDHFTITRTFDAWEIEPGAASPFDLDPANNLITLTNGISVSAGAPRELGLRCKSGGVGNEVPLAGRAGGVQGWR